MQERKIFKIRGMHCAACANLINKFLLKQKGVLEANANFGSESLNVFYDNSAITPEQMNAVLKKLGYSLIIAEKESESEELAEMERQKEIQNLKRRTIISFVFASPIILYYMTVHMFNLKHIHAFCVSGGGLVAGLTSGCQTGWLLDFNWIFFAMTTPIQLGVGWVFYRNAWTAMRVGSASMDVLVVLGTSAAYLISVIGFLFSDLAFFLQLSGLDRFFQAFRGLQSLD